MPKELTEQDLKNRRLKTCVQSFPRAETGEYNPRCCRFPKNCSPYATVEAYQAGNVNENDLEPPRRSMEEAMLETGLYTEKKLLEPMTIGRSFAIETRLMDQLTPGDREAAMDYELERQRVALETYMLTEKLADEEYTERRSTSTPRTWWDMFKITYAMTWWLGWLVRRWPAEYDYNFFDIGVRVERYAKYPEASIPLPSLGRPVPYERITRLTQQELEDLAAQKQMQEERDEKNKEVVTYLLVPETFDDLSDETGLSREWFEKAYEWDQEFDRDSKIYIIPAGLGYDKR